MGVTDCEGAMTHCKKYGARPGRRGEGTPPYKRNTDCETSVRTGFAMIYRKKCDTSPAGEQRCPPLRTFSNRMSWGRRRPRRPVLPNALLRFVGATLAVARFLGDI